VHTEIRNSPSFAAATVHLETGESVRADGGAMLAMSPTIAIETSTQGGVFKGLRRSLLGGESFFLNTFDARNGPGQVTFAPTLPGDIVEWTLAGQRIFLQSGSFLASATTVDVDSSWGGAKTFFSSEGLFLLKCEGTGSLLVASYGAIESFDLAPGQSYTVDTGHVVGWAEGVGYAVRKVGGWKSTFLSGEGLVVDLTGPGRVYLQTRSPQDLVNWLIPKLPRDND
jgi:uncharacterized protein (TIGR00266 family)